MKLQMKLYTDSDLSYASRNAIKSLSDNRIPAIIKNINRFDFNDYVSSTVTFKDSSGIRMADVTYCIVTDTDYNKDYHYYVNNIEFLSGNKYTLGLARNPWTELDNIDLLYGKIDRGVGNNISIFKPNTIQLSETKVNEIYLWDDFKTNDINPLWGILYFNKSENTTTNVNIANFQTTTGANIPKLNDVYYSSYYSGSPTSETLVSKLHIYGKSRLSSTKTYKTVDMTYYIQVESDRTSIRVISFTNESEYKQSTDLTETGFWRYVGESANQEAIRNNIDAFIAGQGEFNATNSFYDANTLEGQSAMMLRNEDLVLNNPQVINNVTYYYENLNVLSNYNGSIILEDGSYYILNSFTEAKKNTSYIDQTFDYKFNNYSSGIPDIDFWYRGSSPFTVSTMRKIYYLTTQTPIYDLLGQESIVSINNNAVNGNIILREPYAICAMPLFDVVDTDNNTYSAQDNQTLFYNLISQHSGENGFVADAQIIPYAPSNFSLAYENGKLSMDKLSVVSSSETYTGFPICQVGSADITVIKEVNLQPYMDVQKEYTLRKYRIQSPSQDSAYDFKFYDFKTGDIESYKNSEDGKLTFEIDITLKPFGIYMHCSPIINQGSLAGIIEFDDIKGIVCGKSIFECSMTSDAFETYKRQNIMYEDIQQRTIETMNISQDTERVNELTQGIIGTLQASTLGAIAGGNIGFGGPATATAAAVTGATAGTVTGGAYAIQYQQNEKLRARELSDAQYFYETNLATIQALPNSLNRVSSFNQDILKRFCIFIEVYGVLPQQETIYDDYAEYAGNNLGVIGNIKEYLTDGKYISGKIFKSTAKPEIYQVLKDQLEKGVYYHDTF